MGLSLSLSHTHTHTNRERKLLGRDDPVLEAGKGFDGQSVDMGALLSTESCPSGHEVVREPCGLYGERMSLLNNVSPPRLA